MNQVLIVAAEASSVHYAQRLLEYWQAEGRDIKAFGVGSQSMESLGFERLGKSEEMAVVGIAEVVAHYSELKAVFDRLVQAAKERKPQVAVVMDYPDFNLRLAKELDALGIPVVYYISPQVWAWRKGRVKTIKKYCRKVFTLFPFEVEFYKAHQVPCEFVGHPLLEDLDEKLFDLEYRKTHRAQCGIGEKDVVLGIMPGSRRGELRQHIEIQMEVVRRLSHKYPQMKFLFLVAPTFEKEDLQVYLENLRVPYILLKDDPYRMIHLTDVVLAASGTATLMVGLLHKPMVIMYKMKWLTGVIAKVFVRGTQFFGLVNLILGKEAVPERWQDGANPEHLTELVSRYVDDPAYRESVIADLKKLQGYLGNKGATARVAKGLEEYFTV